MTRRRKKLSAELRVASFTCDDDGPDSFLLDFPEDDVALAGAEFSFTGPTRIDVNDLGEIPWIDRGTRVIVTIEMAPDAAGES